MTMPKFEPVAWLFKGLKPGYRTEFASIDPCESQTWPADNGMVWNKSELYTSDQLAEAYEAGKRDALAELLILGRTDSHGNVVWFGKNPHAFPPCTEFYAAAPKGEE